MYMHRIYIQCKEDKAIDPMVSELNFGYFSEITLDLTETKRWSKTELELEFWQWVWKARYEHLG